VLTLSSGALCGAFFVNVKFKKWLEDDLENLEVVCEGLGISKVTFLRRASSVFETEKLKFTPARRHWQRIRLTVRGKQNDTERWHNIDITGYVHTNTFPFIIR
jgi:hypothetical protein